MDKECDHSGPHHFEEIEEDQLPEQQSLHTTKVEVCDNCGEIIEVEPDEEDTYDPRERRF